MRFLIVAFSLVVLLLVVGTPSFGAPPLRYSCFTSPDFSITGTDDDFHGVIQNLIYDVPIIGYTSTFTKSIWGLAQCRGDVKGIQCKSCVNEAGNQLLSSCSKSRFGIIWYDNCLVKVHNHSFVGQIDSLNNFCMPGAPVDYNKGYYNWKLNKMFVDLISKATSDTLLFASGEVDLPKSNVTIYGMTQCTQDLTDTDCQTCLHGLRSQLADCCDGKKAGRIMDGSCFIRFGQDPFMLG